MTRFDGFCQRTCQAGNWPVAIEEDCKSKVDAAEAKNAEGASKSTLRIPNPPHLTGKLA